MTGSSKAQVEFRKIRKSYGIYDALKNFDLTINAGEFLTLLGPSGSGKSTALNILAGFTEATSGTVAVGGQDITDLPPEKRNIGMVFQNYSLFPHMSVFDNVAFPLRLRKVSRTDVNSKVHQALEMVQLNGFEERMPAELSGGQRQRVALARAVVFQPRVLLMDEPLAALDLKLREALRFELKKIHSQLGCTIVFVTHDQGEALAMSDRIAVMSHGQLEQIGTPSEIYDAPNSKFVADFIGKTNLIEANFSSFPCVKLPELEITYQVDDSSGGDVRRCDHVSLRPEQFVRVEPGHSAGPSIDGKVGEALFLGSYVQYSIHVKGREPLIFQERRSPDLSPLRKNDDVRLGFAPSDARPVSPGLE